jgi:signal transduction histidine kinase
LRHTPAGGSVTLSLAGTGPTVEVGITDTGSGIAADHLPHIFERYWHGHDDTPAGAPERVGGLGLAIVRRILELHGSMVQVHSALRSGSSFRFVLPQVP